jgi:hypothetical protein
MSRGEEKTKRKLRISLRALLALWLLAGLFTALGINIHLHRRLVAEQRRRELRQRLQLQAKARQDSIDLYKTRGDSRQALEKLVSLSKSVNEKLRRASEKTDALRVQIEKAEASAIIVP